MSIRPRFLYGVALGLCLKDAAAFAARRYGDRLHRLRVIANTNRRTA